MPFRISPLPKALFENLFELSDSDLALRRARRVTATQRPGFPCRVSLADAEIGEELILVNYEHHPVDTPFRAAHAVYIRKNAVEVRLEIGEVPAALRGRTISLRAFDEAGMMVGAELAEGEALEGAIEEILKNRTVAFVHLHFAKPGCYAARADRA